MAGYLFVGVDQLPPDLLQPSDHGVLVDTPADEQQHQDAAGKQGDESYAAGQPGLFEFQLVDVEQGLHFGKAALRLFYPLVEADVVGFPHRSEGFFIFPHCLVQVGLRGIDRREIRFYACAFIGGYGRVDISHGPFIVAHILVIAGTCAVYFGRVAFGAGQLHAFVVIIAYLFFRDQVAQVNHFGVGAHHVARRVAVRPFETVVHRQPFAMQVDALPDLLFGALVFAEHIEVGELVVANLFQVEPLFERVFPEFLQCLLHIGDRLGDVAVGFGRDRRKVDGEACQEFPFDALLGCELIAVFAFEFFQRTRYRFDRIVVVHLFPEVVRVKRRTEQGVAGTREDAVREGDVFLGPPGVAVGEFTNQKVQRIFASVGIPGLVCFGECRFPIGCGQFEAVAAHVGQQHVYPFPPGSIVCLRQERKKAVGMRRSGACRYCGIRKQEHDKP